MIRSKWLLHPISIFIFSILALGASLFLYIYWYIEVSTGLKALVKKFSLDSGQVLAPQTWVVILVLSILVGIILLGIFTIFVYNQKTLQLFRMQRNFINNFTHELKTPATSLKLYLETFLKHELSRKDQLKYTRYMIQDITRLSENINQILNLAQIESKSYKKDFIAMDLVRVVTRFCENNVHLFHHCDITIDNPSGKPFYYQIHLSLFEMLLMNLITNAVKYNDSTVPKVTISFFIGKRKLFIGFEDNGIGLSSSDIKKIFKKFYQVVRPEDRFARGSGLGLFLVQHIARIHKGTVVAESHGEGKGSKFTLILPRQT